MSDTLTIIQVLEYIDIPQLLLANDKFGTQYICLLYEDDPECRYTAIRISDTRIDEFFAGKKDLRELFSTPEYPNEYFDAKLHSNQLECNMKAVETIPEDHLPTEGFFYNSNEERKITVKIPIKDISFFNRLIRSHGWAASLF